jgi:hypothetical protein
MRELVTLLVSLADKLPAIWPDLIAAYQHLKNIWDLLHPDQPEAFRGEDPKVEAAADELTAVFAETTASGEGEMTGLFDRKLIVSFLTFVSNHPELVKLLISFIR